MQLTKWQSGGEYFTYHQQALFYRTDGEGPVLLLIHGYPTASYDWVKLWPTLTQHFRCITLDMLGFGFSSKAPTKYQITEQVSAICALLKHLNVSNAHVVSHDYGDTGAQELMAQQADGTLSFHIDTLHLLNGGLFPETHRALPIQKLLLSPLGGLLIHLLNKNAVRKSMRGIFGENTPPTEQEIDDFWTLISTNNGHKYMHLLLDYMNQRKQHRDRWVTALQNATVPIRLTIGAADPISGAHMAARYRELVPNPSIVELENIGHYPQIESPQQVLASVLNHIEGNTTGYE